MARLCLYAGTRLPMKWQLVNERNSIAHGENGIIIEKNHVSNEIAMLQEAFDMIVLEFENYLSQKLYLKSV